MIDTKGWAGWEWTHGVGLYGIYQYYQQTGDIEMRDIIDRWFADRFAEGATTKNVNTMAPFLTLAYRFEETGRMAYLPWLESWGGVGDARDAAHRAGRYAAHDSGGGEPSANVG
ncbi:Rhamnogalacturonides degradation protein RhiN [Klebsiella pneumoniae]|nr:Rhamnogalacturonides degradation protein RhiN [Klebsiella pneumoniae]